MNIIISHDKIIILSVEEHLYKIRPYLRDFINDLKQSDTWKIQLTITIIFISSKDDNDEEHVMHSKSNNIEIMISDVTDKVIEKLSNSHKDRYQNNLQFKVASLSLVMFSYFIINVIK